MPDSPEFQCACNPARPRQDISMEAERQNQIIARIDDYTERQGLLRRYL